LEFLINEHKYIAELESKLFNSDLVLSYITEAILEKNLYGVDINEESIEIAKLSLWLRTAERGRKLNSLSNHIKCGNSLISDPGIAGELAFNWENEFPDVFENGGFDVIIGNPPWGAKVDQAELKYIKDKHKDIIVRMTDSFMFFIDNSIKFTKLDGYLGLIVPDVFLYQKDNEKLRKKLISHFNITHALNLGDGVFENVARASSIVISHNFKVSNATTFVADISKEQLSNISTIELYNVKQNLFDSIPYTIFPTRDIEGLVDELLSNNNDEYFIEGLKRGGKAKKRSQYMVNRFSEFKNKLGFGSNKVFHSLRSSIITKFDHLRLKKENGITDEMVKYLVGHKIEDITWGLYSNGYNSEQCRTAINMIEYNLDSPT